MSLVVCPKEYRTDNNGHTSSVSDVWEGPMEELQTLQRSIARTYRSTNITPTKGGHGKLVASRQVGSDQPGDGTGEAPSSKDAAADSIEVEWMEGRAPVETHWNFAKLTPSEIKTVKKSAEIQAEASGIFAGDNGEMMAKLYSLIVKGTTEYSYGFPVVRYTSRGCTGLANGKAWFRDEPPVVVPGKWQWLKTADRRTRVGDDVHRIEDWTGFVLLDETLYQTHE